MRIGVIYQRFLRFTMLLNNDFSEVLGTRLADTLVRAFANRSLKGSMGNPFRPRHALLA